MTDSMDQRIHSVAALDHAATRAVYRLLVERGELGRDEAADALELARSVAAFHLDKLVEVGLAEARFERRTGRTGPGAGRTAKLYRRSGRELAVSLPERRYDVAGELLAKAIELASTEGVAVDRALHDAATETGRRLGLAARGEAGPRAGRRKRLGALLSVLERNGYEPRLRNGEIVLENCPFHALAEQHRTVVCGMNLNLLSGIIDGIGREDLPAARLAPEPGYCCVRMKTS